MLDVYMASILNTEIDTFLEVTLGKRIAAAREMAGLNPSELARAVGVTKAAVSQWEKDQTKNLKLENLFEVSRITGCDIYWLGTDSPPPAHAKAMAKFARLPSDFQKSVLDQIESLYSLALSSGQGKASNSE